MIFNRKFSLGGMLLTLVCVVVVVGSILGYINNLPGKPTHPELAPAVSVQCVSKNTGNKSISFNHPQIDIVANYSDQGSIPAYWLEITKDGHDTSYIFAYLPKDTVSYKLNVEGLVVSAWVEAKPYVLTSGSYVLRGWVGKLSSEGRDFAQILFEVHFDVPNCE